MRVRTLPVVVLFSLLACLPSCASSPLSLTQSDDEVHILSNGEPFATVHTSAEPRPYVWPLYAPGGVAVTRNHPMGERDGEQSDHPHHQSLWLAHGNVNGFDFWHGKGHRERVVLASTHATVGHDPYAFVHSEYKWLVDDDTLVMNESRQLRFCDHGDARTIDVLVEFRAETDDVRFGDTKEGMFAMRVHPALRVDGKVATGVLRNSEGRNGKAVWGQRARWIDDSGVVDGESVGVTMMDHPSNLRFPTWWHARNYGLLAANPFGVHDFAKQPAGTGDFVLKKGETLSLRYRVLLHGEGWDDARIEAAYEEWAGQ
ncbi:MAG: hypothetical protein ACI9SE_003876 [Neolewinella sp.]|jgi:hypothetical protein